MLLANVADIVSSLGFDSMPDINAAVTAALHSAEAILSARLDCDFLKATQTDYFFVKEPLRTNGLFNETHFRLKHSLVNSGSLILTYATTKTGVADGTSIETTSLVVDADAGQITDAETPYYNSFVAITYEHGFDEVANDSYDLDQVPDWLERAARIQCLIELASHPVMKQANITLDPKTLGHELDALLSKRKRYMPLAISAL